MFCLFDAKLHSTGRSETMLLCILALSDVYNLQYEQCRLGLLSS